MSEHDDGRHDFDFFFGSWEISNRKLADARDSNSGWLDFQARQRAWPLLGGLGNSDSFVTEEFPGRGYFEGMTLRLFDPETGLWRIWWASTSRPGHLDPPVVGRFEDGVGRFECGDELDGQPIEVRFEWKEITQSSAVWEQSFSFDDGVSWQPNWVMRLTRVEET